MLFPWRTASGFDPFKVTHRLRDEFHEWFGQQYQQDPTKYSEKQWGAGMSHWPVIEDFLKDKYPAAHRGLMTGREDASALLDYPEASGIMSRYDDETGSDIQPYSSADHEKLGYDPAEVAAGMVLLHNQNRDGLSNGYLDEDKDRLVDIFNKRQQMQRNYEQRTGALEDQDHPAEGEGFDAWRNRLWDGVMNGKTFNPNAPGSYYRAMSDKEYQAGVRGGAFRPLIGDHLYVTDDPDRVAGGSYGAKGGGHIVEFTPQPTHDVPSATIGSQLMEKGVTHIPLDAVRRVWSWNGTDHIPAVSRG